MARTAMKFLICTVLIVTFTTTAFAQQGPAAGSQVSSEWMGGPGPKKHLATIIYAGLAGFVLGLSTLPFYGRPQDYLYNVAYGASAGVIAGTTYVIYQAGTNPRDFYGTPQGARFEIEETQSGRFASRPPVQTLKFSFEF